MITLICGVGRAGKTTYSKNFENVIHLDEMGHKPYRYMNVIDALDEGDVVVEGIYENACMRAELAQAYNGNGKRCIWLNTPKETVIARARETGTPISVSHFRFEPPTYEEGWDEIVVIRGDDEQRINRKTEA